jgi:uncharacterized protein
LKNIKFFCLFFVSLLLFPSDALCIQLTVGARIDKPVKDFKALKKRNIVGQSLDYSCGPASLATLLKYYFQDKISEKEIIKSLLLTSNLEKVKERKGFSLLDLKKFSQSRGYDVVGYKMDLDYLVKLEQPVLVTINIKEYSHFVIFRGLKGDRVFLADPALGNMTMKVDKFMSLWKDGVGLVLSKNDKAVLNGPLRLSKEENAVFADSGTVRRIFGGDAIGKVIGEGEF